MKQYWQWAGGVVLGIVVVGMILPSRARIEREAIIDAHPATVFSLLNDFRQVNRWSPITEGDPNARLDLSGPPTGTGAAVSWSGRIIGEGTETIAESEPFHRIVTRVNDGESGNRIVLGSNNGKTSIVWVYEKDYGANIAGRYFGLLLDGIVGPDLERDLARLADFAESLPRADFSDLRIEEIVVEATDVAYLRTTSLPEATAMSEAMGGAFFEILSFIDRNGLAEAGAPLSITREFSGSKLVFDAAIPVRGVTSTTPQNAETVKIMRSYEGPVIRVGHTGSYASLGRTHDKIAAYLAARGIVRNGDAWESYISDPGRTDQAGLLTYIYYPVRN